MGNEMLTKPTNVPTPPATSQVTGSVPQDQSIFMPEESIWKRYSSHQEFPLSMAASVVLHLFAAGIVVLGSVLVFRFGNKDVPSDLEAVVFAGGGGSGDGIGDPDGPEMLQAALKFDPSASAELPPDINPEDYTKIEAEGDIKVEKQMEEQAKIQEQLARGERRAGLTGDRGEGGSGRGGGQGDGFGGGYGDGVGPGRNTSKRSLRQSRWTIVLPREDPDLFKRKLIQIKAILLIPEGSSVASFKINENLEKMPPEFKPIDQKGINAYNRLWYMSHDKVDCDYIARSMYLKDSPRWFAIFIPQDLEQEMLRQELNHKKMSEDEINNKKWITIFDVDRRGDSWDVRVRYQGPRKR